MKKILFITNSSSFSGAEKVSLTISQHLKEKYKFVFVLVGNGNMQNILNENKIDYITLDKLSFKNLKKIIKLEKPDLIHANDFRASFIASFFSAKCPFIMHIHQNPSWLRKFSLNSLIFLYSAIKSKKVLTVSNSITKEYIFSKLILKKIINISNPVSCDEIYNIIKRRKNINDRKYDLCYVGRLVEVKRVDMLVDIVKKLSIKFPNISCLIVGDGYLFDTLKQKTIDLKLENNIEFCGFQSNPYRYLNNSKIFCLTSKWEGYGLVAFEALSLGLPVVASNVGGLKDIVDNNCGYLCDEFDEFVTAINNLLADNNLLIQKSNGSYEKAKKLDNIDDYINNIVLIYEKEMRK